MENSLGICFVWMYIYKYIIFKRLSVFQDEHRLPLNYPHTKHTNLKRTGNISDFLRLLKPRRRSEKEDEKNPAMDMNDGAVTCWTWDWQRSTVEKRHIIKRKMFPEP